MELLRLNMLLMMLPTCLTNEAWRYYSEVRENNDFITIGEMIVLEHYIDDMGPVWTTSSSSCKITPLSPAKSILVCNVGGIYEVGLKKNGVLYKGTEIKYIHVQKSPYCYKWHAIEMQPRVNTKNISKITMAKQFSEYEADPDTRHTMVRVWIVNPSSSSPQEKVHEVVKPSDESQKLTNMFQSFGQEPELKPYIKGPHTFIGPAVLTGFNESGWWTFDVQTDSHFQPQFKVLSKHVALYGCFVRDTDVFLNTTAFHFPESTDAMLLKGGSAETSFVQDNCLENVAAVLTKSHFWMTQDSFNQAKQVAVTKIDGSDSETIKQAALTSWYLTVLTESNQLLIFDRFGNVTVNLTDEVQITEKVIGIRGRDWCARNDHTGIALNTIAIWTRKRGFLYEIGKYRPLRRIDVPEDILQDCHLINAEVKEMAFDSKDGSLGILLNAKDVANDTWKAVVLLYDWKHNIWHKPHFDLTHEDEFMRFHLKFLKSAQPSYIVWNEYDVYYSYNNGQAIGKLENYDSTENFTAAANEAIQQIQLSNSGEVVLLTNQNHMYCGKAKETYLYKLDSGDAKTAEVLYWYDPVGTLYRLELDWNRIQKTPFPLKNELANVFKHVETGDTCPYIHFGHNVEQVLYHIDKGEVVKVHYQLVYKEGRNMEQEITFWSGNLLDVKIKDSFGFYRGRITETKDIQLGHNPRSDETGTFILEARPSKQHPVCKGPASHFTKVKVGCPYGRHIRIKRPAVDEDCKVQQNYTIPSVAFGLGDMFVDKSVIFDLARVGCPIRVHRRDSFVPEVMLYDSDRPIGSMDANFVIHEEHGRKDFQFNTTMKEAGCQTRAQTWKEMENIANLTSGYETVNLWGPENYRSCFVDSYELEDLSAPYEILNSTGGLGITFPENRNGIFIFHIKVVDPTYSFCDLQTVFAVEVYGATPDSDYTPMLASFLSILSFSILLTVILYVKFQRKFLAELEEMDNSTVGSTGNIE